MVELLIVLGVCLHPALPIHFRVLVRQPFTRILISTACRVQLSNHVGTIVDRSCHHSRSNGAARPGW